MFDQNHDGKITKEEFTISHRINRSCCFESEEAYKSLLKNYGLDI